MRHKKIIDAMHDAMSSRKPEGRRLYLGMSAVNQKACKRKLWLEFRHGFDRTTNFSAESHFEDGNHSETVVGRRLIEGGLNLQMEQDGKQFAFTDDVNTFYRGNGDGIITLENGEKAIWEHKATHPEKLEDLKARIKKNEDKALKGWNSDYYGQAQAYMGASGIKRHIMTVSCWGSREALSSKMDTTTAILETPFDESVYKENQALANEIICTDRMPAAQPALEHNKPLCVWSTGSCEALDVCKGFELPEPTCRNCMYITIGNESISCGKIDKPLSANDSTQYKTCHRYNPDLVVGFDVIDVDDGDVVYRTNTGYEMVNSCSHAFRGEFREVNHEIKRQFYLSMHEKDIDKK